MQSFAVEVLHSNGSATLALRGELDVAGVPTLTEALQEIVARYEPGQVTLDCRGLTFMDASGLGALITHLRRTPSGERPKLVGVNRGVMTILRITDAIALFDVEPLADAIRHGEPFDFEDDD